PAPDLEAIIQRAQDAQAGRWPGSADALARLLANSSASRRFARHARGDVMTLAGEVKRLQKDLAAALADLVVSGDPVEPLPHGPDVLPRDRDSLAQWTAHGVPFDRTTVSALLAIAQTAVDELDRLHDAVDDLLAKG